MKKAISITGFILAVFAVMTQYIISVMKTDTPESGPLTDTIRYFSYMTVWTNILVALCCGSIALFPDTSIGKFLSKATVQAATVVYIMIVGLAYHFLLSSIYHPEGLEYFADLLLHYINPLLYTFYWIAVGDKEPFHYSETLRWLVWPFAYFVFSLVKGFITDWYPYYFVDVVKLGYPQVLTISAMLMAGYALLGLAVIGVSRKMAGTARVAEN